MSKNSFINRITTQNVVIALAEFNSKVVYLGVAVVSHYIDDSSADDVRSIKY